MAQTALPERSASAGPAGLLLAGARRTRAPLRQKADARNGASRFRLFPWGCQTQWDLADRSMVLPWGERVTSRQAVFGCCRKAIETERAGPGSVGCSEDISHVRTTRQQGDRNCSRWRTPEPFPTSPLNGLAASGWDRESNARIGIISATQKAQELSSLVTNGIRPYSSRHALLCILGWPAKDRLS